MARRMGSNPDNVTDLGVSSTMISTPVHISNERILRPSRPMMRPFMSSEDNATRVTVEETV